MKEEAFPAIAGYRFEAKMAEGGMGVVYRAVDDTLGRTVAIKMIRSALLGKGDEAEETVARFLREARAAAQIRSNHVAHVLQFGRTDAGDLFLVLEYLDGKTLTDVLRKEKRVSTERAVHITRQICRGMEAAHQLGIVHRDLKPSNVMLVDQDGDPEFVKILDFGVAKVVGERESGVTRAGMLVGTYTCMAPEQVVNETIDARTDVYALAVMLFRLLTGKPLFEGNDVTAVLYHHVHTAAPAPSKIAPDAGISSALDAIVLRCLEKDPNRRVRSMADLDRALGLSLDLAAKTDQVLAQAPTAIGTGADDETRTSYASREPTAEADDGEVFAESGPIRSMVDPHGKTQITKSGAIASPVSDPQVSDAQVSDPQVSDPPTPGTSTSSREPAALAGTSGEPVVSQLEDAQEAPRRKPLLAAALAVAVLLIAIAGLALSSSGKDRSDVVVVMQPAAATSSAPTVEPAAPPAVAAEPAAPSEPTAESEPAVESEPAAESEPAVESEPATPDAAMTTSDPRTESDAETATAEDEPKAAQAAAKTSTSVKAKRTSPAERAQKKRRAARKKTDAVKSAPKPAQTPPDDDDEKKPRPRFIRVRTGDGDG